MQIPPEDHPQSAHAMMPTAHAVLTPLEPPSTPLFVGVQKIVRPDLGAAANGKSIQHMSLVDMMLNDLDGKDVLYEDCNFSAAIITRGYFFKAKFKNCNFTGTRFIECNFRNATFERCKFDYADFHRCTLPVPQILANLPSFANVRRELLHNLRANTHSTGDLQYEGDIVTKEIEAEIEHWRNVRQRPSAHYEKYNNFTDKSKAVYHTIRLWIERHIWGHGESLLRLSLASGIALLVLAGVHCVNTASPIGGMTVEALSKQFFASGSLVLRLFIDLPSVTPEEVGNSPYISTFAVVLRYIVIGLAVPILYKKFAKR